MIEKIELDVANRGHITNSYLVYDKNNIGILIDPAYNPKKIISKIVELGINIECIIITHAHADHIGALEEVQKFTKARIFVFKDDFDSLIGKSKNYYDVLGVEKQNLDISTIKVLDAEKTLKVGDNSFEIIHTKGHTKGSICIFYKEENVLFTGDTIFANCYGRCDLYGGSIKEMKESLKKIFSRFKDITIYPGHGASTNIEEAKKYIRLLFAINGDTLR